MPTILNIIVSEVNLPNGTTVSYTLGGIEKTSTTTGNTSAVVYSDEETSGLPETTTATATIVFQGQAYQEEITVSREAPVDPVDPVSGYLPTMANSSLPNAGLYVGNVTSNFGQQTGNKGTGVEQWTMLRAPVGGILSVVNVQNRVGDGAQTIQARADAGVQKYIDMLAMFGDDAEIRGAYVFGSYSYGNGGRIQLVVYRNNGLLGAAARPDMSKLVATAQYKYVPLRGDIDPNVHFQLPLNHTGPEIVPGELLWVGWINDKYPNLVHSTYNGHTEAQALSYPEDVGVISQNGLNLFHGQNSGEKMPPWLGDDFIPMLYKYKPSSSLTLEYQVRPFCALQTTGGDWFGQSQAGHGNTNQDYATRVIEGNSIGRQRLPAAFNCVVDRLWFQHSYDFRKVVANTPINFRVVNSSGSVLATASLAHDSGLAARGRAGSNAYTDKNVHRMATFNLSNPVTLTQGQTYYVEVYAASNAGVVIYSYSRRAGANEEWPGGKAEFSSNNGSTWQTWATNYTDRLYNVSIAMIVQGAPDSLNDYGATLIEPTTPTYEINNLIAVVEPIPGGPGRRVRVNYDINDGTVAYYARTLWGPSGGPLSYDHTSTDPYPSHSQVFPVWAPYSVNEGPALTAGDYDFVVQVLSPGGSVLHETSVQTINLPVIEQPPTNWDNLESPVGLLSNPIVYRGLGNAVIRQNASDGFNVGGTYYEFPGDASRDVLVDLTGVTVNIPIWVRRSRNLAIVAGTVDITPPTGSEDGAIGTKKIYHTNDQGVKNNHPYIQTNRAVGAWGTRTTWVEGMLVKLNGIAADAFVINVDADNSDATDSQNNRHVKFINTRASGWEGNVGFDNQGIHGDFQQNQNAPPNARTTGYYTIENVVSLSSYNHFTFHSWSGPTKVLNVRNLYCDIDPTYGRDQSTGGDYAIRPDNVSGTLFGGVAQQLNIDELYYRTGNPDFRPFGVSYGEHPSQYHWCGQDHLGNTRTEGSPRYSGAHLILDDFQTGSYPSPLEPFNSFAPESDVGANYVSPWADYWNSF